jgi:hypothetical protein
MRLPIKYDDYDPEKSNIRFNKRETEDREANIAIRSTLAFFRNHMVIYRGKEFEVAVRTFDLVELS